MNESLESSKMAAWKIDRKLHTLDHWRRKFIETPSTIECSEMRLIGRDQEGVIFSGPGRIEIESDAKIRFYLYGKAIDGHIAFKKYISAKNFPYDILEQFRLSATDYEGNEWLGGWTNINLFTDHQHGWPLTGELSGLSINVTGPWVSKTSSVELLLAPKVSLQMSEQMVSTTRIGPDNVGLRSGPGRQIVEILGTKIVFSNEPSDKALWITAETSSEFQHPFIESWLCEPLRILVGAPIYPRMVARNLGNGTAYVMLLSVPVERRESAFGLMHPWSVIEGHNATSFWKLYADILTMIAHARTPDGHEVINGHQITNLYEELVQAERGSRWVMMLTLASTIEALAKSLMTKSDGQSEFSDEALKSMKKHIKSWKGNNKLKSRMLGSLSFASRRGAPAFLKDLARKNIIPDHYETWSKIRNSVMHGDLVEPWPTQEGDTHLKEMTALVHALTRLRIAKRRFPHRSMVEAA